MKKTVFFCIASISLIAALACGVSPTPDTQGTVDAAVSATGTAQVDMQATIDAAVQTTQDAAPAPTPAAEYEEMAEEELATEIDEAVEEASTATEECSEAAAEAAADGTITAEEAEELEEYAAEAELAVAYAEELIYAYYDLYGELATETLELLLAIEDDLVYMADELAALNAVLVEIDEALAQGLALTEETIEQLQTAAQTAGSAAAGMQAQSEAWLAHLREEMEGRAAAALAVQPSEIAGDRQEAIQMAFQYVDGVREGLADGKVTPSELSNIAQLGANASGGLKTHGNPQLQELSGSIDTLTGQIAKGQVPQAKTGVNSLESALGTRPAPPPKPSRP